MRPFTGKNQGAKEMVVARSSTTTPLDEDKIKVLYQTTEYFEITDLLLERGSQEDSNLVLSYRLDQRHGNSGKNQNPAPPTFISLRAESKEVALFSGLLNREVRIERSQSRYLVSQARLLDEISHLRGVVEELKHTNQILSKALDSLQSLRKVS